ncbi:MAG: hypothetical protein HYV07_26035 [Deltaproteobacteria bacterium]|nr:hypothetical protein [Deltaproteobacteria bacterium]
MTRELHCYEYVNHSYDSVRTALLADPIALFQRATAAAVNRANTVAANLSVSVGALEIGTGISIVVTAVETDTHAVLRVPLTRIKLEWRASQSASLFPSMVAELDVYPLSSAETQLVLAGEYRAPGGAIGAAADAVLLHRVAEASVHKLLRQLSERLRLELDESTPGQGR